MINPDIARQRLTNQQITGTTPQAPAEIVRRLGAMQSQDYYGARWAVGLRAGLTALEIEQAVAEGSILRLHVLRPTWHFVTAEDVRWMLALTGPRVSAAAASRYRELELDQAVFDQSQAVFRQVLAGNHFLTRGELETALNQAGISTELPQRLVHILMQAELEGLICSGPWAGKQATYALIDERVPPIPTLSREAALAELALRFFSGHGPATIKDFRWWSGLTAADARAGIDLVRSSLELLKLDGQEYFTGSLPARGETSPQPVVHLLPNFDEYVVAYTDRSAIFDSSYSDRLRMRGGALNHVFIQDGLVIGGWSKELKKNAVTVTATPLWPLDGEVRQALELAVQQYGKHLGLAANLRLQA